MPQDRGPDGNRTMVAAQKTGQGVMEVATFPRPTPGADEVLVRVERAAICGSDLHAVFEGLGSLIGNDGEPAPGRPGHEAVGTVEASSSPDFAVGQRVLVLSVGAFAEYMLSPASMCLALPDDVPSARLLMAQQLGVVLYGMERFWPSRSGAGSTATVIGAGPVGLHFLSALRLWGFERVIMSEVVTSRIELARKIGADLVVDATLDSVVDATARVTGGAGSDLVIEAVGLDATRAEAVACVRQYGKVGLFGYPERFEPSPFPFSDAFWKAPISIEIVKGAQWVPGLPTFHEAVRVIASGQIDVDYLLGTEYRLADIQQAMAAARSAEAIKVQVLP